MAWYNTYRPTNFNEVVGQTLVKKILQNALEKNLIKHAYLFSGPKGVGKTTLARIFAHELNNITKNPEASIDIIEMDAASNTGIDDIRNLIESAQNPPISGTYKIYIIDEVHMLSKSAMNALLKILEEPPAYLIFLLATTNPEKLLPTVLSRLTKLTLTSHSIEDIVSQLEIITKKEQVHIDKESLQLIAQRSFGGQRDAINMLETIASFGLDKYTIDDTASLLGLLPEETMSMVASYFSEREHNTTLLHKLITKVQDAGIDGESFLAQLLEFILDQSLTQKQDFSNLIISLSELISKKLPITDVASTFALIQAFTGGTLDEKKTFDIVQKPSGDSTKPVTEPKKEEAELEQHQPENIIEPQELEKIEETLISTEPATIEEQPAPVIHEAAVIESATQTQPQLETPASISQQDLTITIKKLATYPDAPATFKMVLPDLGIDLNKNTLLLTTSSGIFQGTLSSPKLQQWIIEKLQAVYNQAFTIQTSIRSTNQNPSQPISQATEVPANIAAEPVILQQPTPAPQEQEGDHFYTVYKRLPINMDDKGVHIRKEEVQPPEEENQAHDWDSHTKELFDFE